MLNWKSLVIGKILGDGRVDGSSKNGGSLYFEHAIAQHEYVYDTWEHLTTGGLECSRPVLYRRRRSLSAPFTYSLGWP